MANLSPSLLFKVQRSKPEMICPNKPTPHELKYLSDIDDQEGFRYQVQVIQFYKNNENMEGKDPVKVIREAIRKALVFYYPFAGRLREGENRKLMVDCTGQGIVFIEADASVRLNQFGDVLHPPFPCLEELLYDVTRLMCGGFIFALRLNHTMADAAGLVQFMIAVSEIARGASHPSVEPVWNRELLSVCGPLRVTCIHHEYVECTDDSKCPPLGLGEMVHHAFFFGPQEAVALRKHVPPHLHSCSMFELLTACIWRCRTLALNLNPSDQVRILNVVNARKKFNPNLPAGYYGNVFAFPAAVSTAGELCNNPLGYALQLVKKAKAEVTEEYMMSVANLMVLKGRPCFPVSGTYIVSDVTRAGFSNVDFGWGKAVYGGNAKVGIDPLPGAFSYYMRIQNNQGEDKIVVPVSLPRPAMERFVIELERTMKEPEIKRISPFRIVSGL
ncbi:hypothetical protein ACHQM5_006927 [Ranunculus cassubicifolius]